MSKNPRADMRKINEFKRTMQHLIEQKNALIRNGSGPDDKQVEYLQERIRAKGAIIRTLMGTLQP